MLNGSAGQIYQQIQSNLSGKSSSTSLQPLFFTLEAFLVNFRDFRGRKIAYSHYSKVLI